MNNDVIKLLDLDELGILEFKKHNTFNDSIQAIKLFDNGYAGSIICKCYELKNSDTIFVMFSSHGSWENQSFEIACVVVPSDGNFTFLYVDSIAEEYPEYEQNYGVLNYKNKTELKEILNFIKSMPSRINV